MIMFTYGLRLSSRSCSGIEDLACSNCCDGVKAGKKGGHRMPLSGKR